MRYSIYLIIVAFCFSCGKSESKKEQEVVKTIVERSQQNEKVMRVDEEAKYLISDIEYYADLRLRIENLEEATKSQILNEGEALSILTISLKDSTENVFLNEPAMRARMNALYTISMRLKDMNDIPSITEEEVFATGNEIIKLYNSLISRINAEAELREMEKSIQESPEALPQPKRSEPQEIKSPVLIKPQKNAILLQKDPNN